MKDLGKAIINDFEITGLINQDVFEFEVPMDDSFGVEVPDRNDHLRRIEHHCLFIKSLLLQEYLVKFTASNEGHHKIEAQFVLEKVLHANEEGMACLKQDLLLKCNSANLIGLNKYILSYRLDGVQLLGAILSLELGQEDFAKSTPSYDHQEVEVFKSDLQLCRLY